MKEDLITIGRKNEVYRPCYIKINNKEYQIEKIHIFNKEGILYSTYSGWFEKYIGIYLSEDITEFTLNDVVLKRKINYNLETNFIISLGKDDYSNEKLCELYIHDATVQTIKKQVVKLETNTTTTYHDIKKITLNELEFNVSDNITIQDTDFGIKVKQFEKMFKDDNIDINRYHIQKILELYNIEKKEGGN
ncbi:hypothetical protein [Methanolobus sp. WCC4]|uniref:hypothetical protein n=1 Tax=Methanolobus sp. WCC4 TaxID=3125784 RepID=UPI0030F6E6E4